MIRKSSKVYISGPMSGHPDFNFPAFHAMESLLKDGFKCRVFNPAHNPTGLSYEQYMAIDLAAIASCDTIVMLDGWQSSRGATMERRRAKELGLKILSQTDVRAMIYQAEYRKNNADKLKEYFRKYRQRFREKINAARRKKYRTDPEYRQRDIDRHPHSGIVIDWSNFMRRDPDSGRFLCKNTEQPAISK